MQRERESWGFRKSLPSHIQILPNMRPLTKSRASLTKKEETSSWPIPGDGFTETAGADPQIQFVAGAAGLEYVNVVGCLLDNKWLSAWEQWPARKRPLRE